ncbi:MAG TPA: hypothetical protein VF193_14085 [Steroidobacter sp.]
MIRHKYFDLPFEADPIRAEFDAIGKANFIGAVVGGALGFLGARESAKAASRAADKQAAAIDRQMDIAEEEWQHYLDVYGPMAEQLVADVSGLSVQERRELQELERKAKERKEYEDRLSAFQTQFGESGAMPSPIFDALRRQRVGDEVAGLTEEEQARLNELREKAAGPSEYLRTGRERLDALEAQQGEILDNLGGRLDALESEYRLDPEAEAARAAADVSQSFGLQREAAARQRARFAVDPTSGAAVAADTRMDLNQAKARGFAKNAARRAADDINFQRGSALYGQRAGLAGTRIAALNDNFTRRTALEDADLNRKLAVQSLGRGLPAAASAGFRGAASQAGDAARMHAADVAGMVRFGADIGSRVEDYFKGRNSDDDSSFAEGGEVRGPGTSTSDSVPALIDGQQPARLSDGEYVMSEAAVRWHGLKKLNAMNEEGQANAGTGPGLPREPMPPARGVGLARGGYVASARYAAGGMVGGRGLRMTPRYAAGGPIETTDPVARRHEIAKRLRAHGMGAY